VNSGKSRDARDAETNALETNKEAVDEIARQLRLRDMGGVVVCDLIDMMAAKNRRTIEQRFRAALKSDRARTRLGSISQFGLVELTRQRMRPSLRKSIYVDCDHCHGVGHVRSAESTVLDVMRDLAVVLQRPDVHRVELTISPDVAFQVLNRKRRQLTALENRFAKDVLVRVGGRSLDYVHVDAYDDRGGLINPDRLFDLKHLKADDDSVFREVVGAGISERVTVEDDDDLPETPDVTPPEAAVPSEDFIETPPAEDGSLSRGDLAALDEKEQEAEAAGKKRKRRRRGGRRRKKSEGEGEETPPPDGDARGGADPGPPDPGDGTSPDQEVAPEDARPVDVAGRAEDGGGGPAGEDGGDRPKRRSRGGRRRKKSQARSETQSEPPEPPEPPASPESSESSESSKGDAADAGGANDSASPPGDRAEAGGVDGDADGPPKKKRRRSRGGTRSKSGKKKSAEADPGAEGDGGGDAPEKGYSNRVLDPDRPQPAPDPASPEPGNEREPEPATESSS